MHNITEIINKRLIGQYKDSPVILAFLNSLSSEYNFLHTEIKRVVDERYFDNAKNINLDIIGSIVGIGRKVTDFVETDYFSFLQDPTGKGFDSLTETVKAGRYRSADENTVTTRKLNDSEYRILINAKILKNISNITPNDVLLITRQILELMYPNNVINVEIIENGNAGFQVKINYILSPAEKSFIASLDLIPRPVGVRIEYIYEDVDFPIEVSLSSILEDSIVGIAVSIPNNSMIENTIEDSIISISSNAIASSSITGVLEDSIVSIQVAPPGTISLTTLAEDSVVSSSVTTEQGVNLGVITEDSITSISSGVVDAANISIVNEDSTTDIQTEVVPEQVLARIVPIDFISSCSLICTGGDYTVDWGNGNIVSYSAGATATSVPSGNIKVKEVGVVTNIKFTSDTYSSIVIEEGSNLTNMNSVCLNLSQLVSFTVDSLLPLMTGQMFDSFNGCSSLLVAPSMDYSAIDGFARTFQNCVSMTSSSNISVSPPTSMTTMNSTFLGCSSLTDITVFPTALVSDWRNSFGSCTSLIKLPAFNTSVGTSFDGMFNNSNSLQCIANIDTTSTLSATTMFSNTPALTAPDLTEQANLESAVGSSFSTTCP